MVEVPQLSRGVSVWRHKGCTISQPSHPWIGAPLIARLQRECMIPPADATSLTTNLANLVGSGQAEQAARLLRQI